MSKVYTIGGFAERVGVSPSTLRRWDDSGRLPAKRRESGHRYYDEADVRLLLNRTEAPDEGRCMEAIDVFVGGGRAAVGEWLQKEVDK